jgi:osmoprotectant transport system substrate-binding protein
MKPSTLITRIAGAGLAAATALTLAACGSSGGEPAGNAPATNANPPAISAPDTTAETTAAATPSAIPADAGKGAPAISMGDKNFAEEYLLGQMYSQALKAKGFTVTLHSNIGNSETIDKALTSGKIDMYPEYTGVIYTELAKLGDRPKSAAVTYAGAKKWEGNRGYTLLQPTPFQDKDCIATLKPYAQKYNLKDIGDLKKVGKFTYGAPPENKHRYQGVVGMKQAYGLNNVVFKPLDIGLQYAAIDKHQVDTIACFTTDGQLASGKYAVLTDSKGIFGYQQVAPVVKTSLLDTMPPAFTQILNQVSSLLTQKAIITMNEAVQVEQKKPAAVAKAFLQANGLL